MSRVYVDGGQVISPLLQKGLLTRLNLTQVPVLIGEGIPRSEPKATMP